MIYGDLAERREGRRGQVVTLLFVATLLLWYAATGNTGP